MALISRRTLLISTGALMALPSLPAFADGHVVQMLNKDPDNKKRRMIFKPVISVIEPGTTLKFESSDKGHNTQSIKGMIPEGAEPWKSKISKDFDVTIEMPGVYGFKCTPHYATGMVGLILCKGDGMLDNLEAAQNVKQRGKAKKIWKAIWEQAEEEGLLTA